MFRALKVRNFRLFFIGQVLNVTGSWVHSTAIAWIVVRETGGAAGLGTIIAMQFLPLLLLGAWAGALADRHDRRRLLAAANLTAAVIALATGLLVTAGHRSVLVLATMSLLLGITSAFETPTRQSLLGQLVGPTELSSAVGLNAAVMTGSRMAGSAVAGILIVTLGSTTCLYVNAASFLATVVAVVLMRESEIRQSAAHARGEGGVIDGLRYAIRRPEVRFPLVAMAVVGTLALNSTVTTPLLARITFHAGAALFAAFSAVAGFGALLGALTMASRREARLSLIGGAALAFGLFTLVVAASPNAVVALPLLAMSSFAASLYISATNARLQAVADDNYRGRVMSLYSVLFLGSTPIGSVVVSVAADLTQSRVALGIGGVAATATGLVALARLRARRLRGRTGGSGAAQHLLTAGRQQGAVLPPDGGAATDETLARGG